jgi:hypothetical protein
MAHQIQDFKSTLIGGGARPNLFQVDITGFPGSDEENFDAEDFSILCKAAQLPASNVASIDVPFRGRIFKVAGDRTFDEWTVTVINDNNFVIRSAMERWMQKIAQYGDGSGFTDPADYQIDAVVKQFRRLTSADPSEVDNGMQVAKKYKFYSIFPTNISAIELSYDSSDTIEEFTVTFQVQYWAPDNSAE